MKIYKSNFPYLAILVFPISIVLTHLIYSIQLRFLNVLIYFILLYIYYCFVWIRFEIHEKYLIRKYVVRPFGATREIPYETIYSVEVRKTLRQRFSYVIIHCNKNDENSFFILSRSFIYFRGKIVENFITAIKSKGVFIKLNIDKEYKKDFIRFNNLLKLDDSNTK